MLKLFLLAVCVVSVAQAALTDSQKEALNHYGHNADFVHQFYVKGQWWCSIRNLLSEFREFDNKFFLSLISDEKVTKNLNLPSGHVCTMAGEDMEKQQAARWFAVEVGLLSSSRGANSMFHLKGHGSGEIDNPFGTALHGYGAWAREENIQEDQELYGRVRDICLGEGDHTDEIYNVWTDLVDHYCVLEVPTGGPSASSSDDMRDSLDALMDDMGMKTPSTSRKAVIFDPAAMIYRLRPERRPTCAILDVFRHPNTKFDPIGSPHGDCPREFSETCGFTRGISDFFTHQYSVKIQNVYKYHDTLHGALFGTAVYLQMKHYNAEHQTHGHPFTSAEMQAGAVAGLMHDVGYVLMPRWLFCTDQCATPELGLSRSGLAPCLNVDNKGHELASLIATLYLFRKFQERESNPRCQGRTLKDTIMWTILSTKIKFVFKTFSLHGPDVTDVKGIWDAIGYYGTIDKGSIPVADGRTIFEAGKAADDTQLELNKRMQLLMRCVYQLDFLHTADVECRSMYALIDTHNRFDSSKCPAPVEAREHVKLRPVTRRRQNDT